MVAIRKSERWGSSQLKLIEDSERVRRKRKPLEPGKSAIERFRSRQNYHEKQIDAAVARARKAKFPIGRWSRAPRGLKLSDRVSIQPFRNYAITRFPGGPFRLNPENRFLDPCF